MGVDILDLGTERLSWRRLGVLLAHLPRDSWTAREVVGESTRWGEQEHLLATDADLLVQANWMYAAAHSKTTPELPKPLRRPGEPDPTVRLGNRTATPREFRSLQSRMRLKERVSDGS